MNALGDLRLKLDCPCCEDDPILFLLAYFEIRGHIQQVSAAKAIPNYIFVSPKNAGRFSNDLARKEKQGSGRARNYWVSRCPQMQQKHV